VVLDHVVLEETSDNPGKDDEDERDQRVNRPLLTRREGELLKRIDTEEDKREDQPAEKSDRHFFSFNRTNAD
jgi:hypothetical protein